MEAVRITHFSDVLCVWAYVSEIRCDELLEKYPVQVSMDCRYLQVFGNLARKMESQWAAKGGILGYAEHVRQVTAGFDHVSVHPEVWLRGTPQSSLPGHLFLCAVRLLEQRGEAETGALRRTAWRLREAFFTRCADVSQRAQLLQVAENEGLSVARIEGLLDSGAAGAALCEDLELAREQEIRASPTLVFNEGRQRLTGNVGYRIIEANVRELLERPAGQRSWC
ncbi:MAG TPA: DsbA family protein [Myxococcota bacterium]